LSESLIGAGSKIGYDFFVLFRRLVCRGTINPALECCLIDSGRRPQWVVADPKEIYRPI
jgi:hypothetical protein